MIEINRVAKVVKGGRRFSFTALVAVGDEDSVVGIGYGKAREVPLAIQKAVEDARKNLIRVPKYGQTITHRVIGRFGAGHVVLRPASPGTGVIAGGGVRAVLELGGVRDVLTKSIGTQNPINLVKATMSGLESLRRPEDVAKLRGISIREVLGVGNGKGAAQEVAAPKEVDAPAAGGDQEASGDAGAAGEEASSGGEAVNVSPEELRNGGRRSQAGALLERRIRHSARHPALAQARPHRQGGQARRHSAAARHDPHREPSGGGRRWLTRGRITSACTR